MAKGFHERYETNNQLTKNRLEIRSKQEALNKHDHECQARLRKVGRRQCGLRVVVVPGLPPMLFARVVVRHSPRSCNFSCPCSNT